jgi:catechol 2,3-dioxygenase-like lactoylglutathione lyase family enzyme
MPGTFDHIGVAVRDLARMTAFYTDVLGMRLERSFERPEKQVDGVMLIDDSGYRVELVHRPDPQPRPNAENPLEAADQLGFYHFCLCVDDVDAVHADLLARGAVEFAAPGDSPRGAGARVSHVLDPERNVIELISRPAGS